MVSCNNGGYFLFETLSVKVITIGDREGGSGPITDSVSSDCFFVFRAAHRRFKTSKEQ